MSHWINALTDNIGSIVPIITGSSVLIGVAIAKIPKLEHVSCKRRRFYKTTCFLIAVILVLLGFYILLEAACPVVPEVIGKHKDTAKKMIENKKITSPEMDYEFSTAEIDTVIGLLDDKDKPLIPGQRVSRDQYVKVIYAVSPSLSPLPTPTSSPKPISTPSPRTTQAPPFESHIPTLPPGQSRKRLVNKADMFVYTGPGENYFRNGNVRVGSGALVTVIGFELSSDSNEEWILIEYRTSDNLRRRGFIPAKYLVSTDVIPNAIPKAAMKAEIGTFTRMYDILNLKKEASLYINKGLSAGTEVLLIAKEYYRENYSEIDLAYIEALVDDVPTRGFIEFSILVLE